MQKYIAVYKKNREFQNNPVEFNIYISFLITCEKEFSFTPDLIHTKV